MKNIVSRLSLLLGSFLLLLFYSCAQIVAPRGGEKDTTPPRLDTLSATPNFQTNFTKQTIKLPFDEFLQIKDAINQVVVAPPLQYPVQLSIQKKSVLVNFHEEEVLRENATYVIHFGDAIQDFTEGNATNLRYVFSTGPHIDSLEISATVVDALSGAPVSDALVMLYDNLADTVVRTERPLYFGKTNEVGKVTIKNMRADTFRVFALKDATTGRKYLYDQPNEESIGFLDSFLVVTTAFVPELQLVMSLANPRPRRLEVRHKAYGQYVLQYSNHAESVSLDWVVPAAGFIWRENMGDSLKVWYNLPPDAEVPIYETIGETKDTLLLTPLPRNTTLLTTDTFQLVSTNKSRKTINPKKPLRITYNLPLLNLHPNLIELLVDSTLRNVPFSVAIDSIARQQIVINRTWQEGQPYEVRFLPGAITDWFGRNNSDTLKARYYIAPSNEFSDLTLTIDSLQKEKTYVLQLLFQGDNLVQSMTIKDTTTFQQAWSALPPGAYTVKLIEDRDKNGKWSPANYDSKQQAEKVFEKKLETLRANWEVESTLILREKGLTAAQ